MTKTKNKGMTQRTYHMSERSKTILDQINIVTNGYSKADLVNFAIYWMATSIKEIQDKEPIDITSAMLHMQGTMSSYGYDVIRDNVMKNLAHTKLDRFFLPLETGDKKDE